MKGRAMPAVLDPEFEPEPAAEPPGVRLEYPSSEAVLVEIEIDRSRRVILAAPRLLAVLLALLLTLEAFRHRVFIVFWIFGWPFLRWLRGPGPCSLLIGERELVVNGARAWGGSLIFPRSQIASVGIGRAGAFALFQPALMVRDRNGTEHAICPGIRRDQAEFVRGGLQRWLSGAIP